MSGIGRRGLILGLTAAFLVAGPGQSKPAQKAGLETLEIVTSRGTAKFTVEIAATPAQQQRGLMFRTSLAPDKGMLFTYAKPQSASFWMKNTLIPLDIIYIAPNGRVLSIARNAIPHDETPIPSGGYILGVLEIAGGRANQLGILPGDRVRHRIFPKG